jgi:hypothetical protein
MIHKFVKHQFFLFKNVEMLELFLSLELSFKFIFNISLYDLISMGQKFIQQELEPFILTDSASV